jgi:hypothetical protein
MPRFFAALFVVALALPLCPWAVHGERPRLFVDFAALTVGATLLGLLPSTVFLVRKGWLRAWQTTSAGAFVGVIVAALVAVLFAVDATNYLLLGLVLSYGGVLGALHGFAFWLLAVFKNAALANWLHTPPSKFR